MGERRTVVLVHGAWHGAWCWASVLAGLDERGVPAVAVDLPGPGLHDDVDHVRGVLDGIDGAVVLVGHSYGGAVVTGAGVHPSVEHLVYLAAFAPEEGETALGLLATDARDDLRSAVVVRGDGTSVLDPERVPAVFYGDCDDADVERAVSLLRPLGSEAGVQETPAVAWRHRPTTFVICGADRVVPPTLQRTMAVRIPGAAVVEWPDSSHSPFLSRPGDVVDLLAGVAVPG